MSFVSKDGYARKAAYAEKRMEENSRVETLTESQHSALAELCNFRHFLHTNWRSAFLSDSAEFSEIYEEIGAYGCNPLMRKIEELFGVVPFSTSDYPTDFDYEDYEEYESYEDAYGFACSEFERINTEIEDFLRDVDKKHGTHYCPTGATRLF